MTNFEKIKSMTVEEMAGHINDKVDTECSGCPAFNYCAASTFTYCYEMIRKWLERECEEDD